MWKGGLAELAETIWVVHASSLRCSVGGLLQRKPVATRGSPSTHHVGKTGSFSLRYTQLILHARSPRI